MDAVTGWAQSSVTSMQYPEGGGEYNEPAADPMIKAYLNTTKGDAQSTTPSDHVDIAPAQRSTKENFNDAYFKLSFALTGIFKVSLKEPPLTSRENKLSLLK
eukprot:8142058-Heterocapsa_arctica.AAC.1